MTILWLCKGVRSGELEEPCSSKFFPCGPCCQDAVSQITRGLFIQSLPGFIQTPRGPRSHQLFHCGRLSFKQATCSPLTFWETSPVFLLRWEDKYQIWERPGQCITFSGWKKRRSGGRSMRGAAHIQMGVLSGRTKGSFCSPLFSRRLGASSRLLSDEARGTLFPISGGGRGSRIPRALRPGHVGLLCAPHHLVQGTCPLWAWEEARPCHRFLQKTAKNPSPCSTHTLLWIS